MVCRCGALGTLLAVTLAGLCFGAPLPPRSLKEEQALLAQTEKGEQWVPSCGKAITLEGKRIKIRHSLILTKGTEGLDIVPHRSFKAKPGPLGIFSVGVNQNGGSWHFSLRYYRLKKKNTKRYLVVTGNKPGEEITFEYEFDGKVLKLKGGAKLDTFVGPLDINGEYKRDR